MSQIRGTIKAFDVGPFRSFSFPSILLLIRATSHQRSLKSVRPHRLSIGYIGADQIYVRERLRLFYWLIPKNTNLWRVGVAG